MVAKYPVRYGAWIEMRKALIWIAAFLPSTVWAQEIVVAAFGDSLTQGYGLAQEQGFVPQMQAWLDEKGVEARLINAGVTGDTTAGGLARIEWTLTPDVDALIVALGGNDLLRGLDPSVSRENIEGILRAATKAEVDILLVGMQAPGNFGPSYKTEFDAIYPELAVEYDAVHAPSFFQGIEVEEGNLVSAQRYMQADGIHPNSDGVIRIVDALGPYVISLLEKSSE